MLQKNYYLERPKKNKKKNKAIHTNKDNCDQKSAEKMFKLKFYIIV